MTVPTPFAGAALLLALSAAGCSGAYWTDRGRDFLDVPTVALECQTLGAIVLVGPFGTGLFFTITDIPTEDGVFGLVGGRFGSFGALDRAALVWYRQSIRFDNDTRRKQHSYSGWFPWPVLYPWADRPKWHGGPLEDAPDRRRLFPRYTQIQVQASAVLGARIGLNPGEFVDFLTGWFGLDLYGDDVAGREKPAGATKKPPANAAPAP